MKIVIAGDGKVGNSLTRQLSAEGHDITVIDSNSRVLESSMSRYDVMAVHGNCAAMDVLEQADVRAARLFIAVTNADEINLLSCMTAHAMNPSLHTIARIRNPEYTDQIFEMREVFGLSLSVNPERQTALEIERQLKYPGFLKRELFAKGRVEIVEIRVERDSKLCGVKLSGMNAIAKCSVLVCTVLRDGVAVIPSGDFMLEEGDTIFVTAPTANMELLFKNLGMITRKISRVMLIGGGRISFYLAQQLEKSGIAVQIIERDRDKCIDLAGKLPSVSIVHGDASDHAFLESEGLSNCDALVTLTGLDELNMVISLYGYSHSVPKVITKLGRSEDADLLHNLPVGTVIFPKELCCNNIVQYVRAMQNRTGAAVAVHLIADRQTEAIEFVVDETTPHCGDTLKNIRLKRNVLIASITSRSGTVIPNGESSFGRGDTLIVVTSADTEIRQLSDIFE